MIVRVNVWIGLYSYPSLYANDFSKAFEKLISCKIKEAFY